MTHAEQPRPTDMRFLRLPAVISEVGLSKSEIYRRIKAGTFPPPHRLSHRVSVWLAIEINRWRMLALPDADWIG